MRHVKQHLAAYSERLLSAEQEAFVREHITVCDDCREALARHEQLTHDLRLVLGQNPVPRRTQISQWWLAIQPRRDLLHPIAERRAWGHLAAIPTIMAVFVLFLPLAIGLVGDMNPVIPSHPTSDVQPGLEVSLAPPTDNIYGTQEPPNAQIRTVAYTTSAAPSSTQPDNRAIPVIPAPLAP